MNFEELKREYQKVPVEEYPNTVCESIPAPTVTVKVSTYQHADFIRECLNGILMQETTFPFEVVIGEDESSDGTREICMEYADKHPDRIRLFLHSRKNNIRIDGQPTGKFQAMYTRFMCRGRYMALCEGDDYWTDPYKLQKQVDFLEANDEYVLTYHPWVEKHEGTLSSETNDVIAKARSDGNVRRSPHTLTMVYRNVLDDYPPQIMEVTAGDGFLKQLLRLRGKFGYVEDILPGIYRRHEQSTWSSKSRADQALMGARSYVKMREALHGTKVERAIDRKIIWWSLELLHVSFENGTFRKNLPKVAKFLRVLCGNGLASKLYSHPHLRRLMWARLHIIRARLGAIKRRIVGKPR